MRLLGRREWAVLGGTLALLGGLGFVQSRGGWMEVMKMAPKLDSSTPATQGGFELMGVERSTEEERAPRLTVGETSIGGGIVGPIGSVRVWFRLPPSTGKGIRIPRDDELQTYVEFPTGARYPVAWEVGDVSQRIVTLLIPGGYPPSDWMDIVIGGKLGKAKWRLQRIPKTPYALPASGSPTIEKEGMKVAASAVALLPKPLGDDSGHSVGSTMRLDYTVEPPPPKRGNGTRLIWEKTIPEYQHPADQAAQSTVSVATPGERKGSMSASSPYGDRAKHIAAKGRFEVWELVREPVTFKNARWVWTMYIDKKALALQADAIPYPDGTYLDLSEMVILNDGIWEKAPTLKGHHTSSQGTMPEAHLHRSVVDLVPGASAKDWVAKLRALAKSGDPKGSVAMGSVSGYVEYYRVLRKTPFELLVPVRPGTPEEIAAEKALRDRAATGISRDRHGAPPPLKPQRINGKTTPLNK